MLDQIRFSAKGITGWTWANGTVRDELRDLDGRPARITSGNALARQYSLDIANRLIGIADTQSRLNDSYGYDNQDHLVSQQSASTRNSYDYDAIGNRQQRQNQQGSKLTSTSYQYATNSNQLLSETTGTKMKNYTYLPSGQLSSDGTATYSYDDDGRLTDVAGQRPLHNDYNALGRRVRKVGQGVLVFAYDEAGHLLGEYTPGGVMEREYIWLGNRLVGMLSRQEKDAVLQIHTDHLGTPRAVSNDNTVLWRWEGEAFGDSAPNEQVAGPSRKLTLPLRFPGQYYDQETGLNYNYFRDYDAATGRYIESDPIGLKGGVNTYAYVDGSPISLIDPYGLWAWGDPLPQEVVDASAGLGDALLLGTGDYLRDLAGGNGGVDPCSDAYRYGGWGAFAAGGGRLAYAGVAKAGSILAASGAEASAFRAGLKTFFRGGVGRNWRPPNLAGKTDAQLRASAGKTNFGVNAYGAGVGAAGGAGAVQCGCPK